MLDSAPQPKPQELLEPEGLRVVAFYLPQFHPIPENDAFWGSGFTEWRNVVQSRPRFSGHNQPHLPADLGFYDLRVCEVREAQADLAQDAGLHGFCYYHYWFNGRRLLHQPIDMLMQSKKPDFPFMLCWANENWTRAWDGSEREILVSQAYSDADTIAYARHVAGIFADSRYIRVNGRPAFAVYNTDSMPDPQRWTELFRETLLREGFTPYLIRVERYLDRDRRPPNLIGFDAALEFQPFSRSFLRWQQTRPDLKNNFPKRLKNRLARDVRSLQRWRTFDTHHDLQSFVDFDLAQKPPNYTHFPGVCPGWDNSARRPSGKAIIFRNSSPSLFSHWMSGKVTKFDPPSAGENLLFVNAWNEWAEGNHLEPCLTYGHEYLRALKAGLSAKTSATQPVEFA